MAKIPTTNYLVNRWFKEAKQTNATIVLPEAEYSTRVLEAGLKAVELGVAKVVLLARTNRLNKYDNGDTIKVVNITKHELLPMLTSALHIKRQAKGVTLSDAQILLKDPMYFGVMMVELGLADGMVAGAETSTSNVLRPALQIIKGKVAGQIVSSAIILTKGHNTLVFADCGLNINPTSEELALITEHSATTCRQLVGVEPRVAMLSYSSNGSAEGDSVTKVHDAVELLHYADFEVDGEMQLDCALDATIRKLKYPNCTLTDNANVLIFPNLDAGNIGYKLVNKLGGYMAIGPIIQGLNKPVNDVSRGCTADEILAIIAVTAIQSK